MPTEAPIGPTARNELVFSAAEGRRRPALGDGGGRNASKQGAPRGRSGEAAGARLPMIRGGGRGRRRRFSWGAAERRGEERVRGFEVVGLHEVEAGPAAPERSRSTRAAHGVAGTGRRASAGTGTSDSRSRRAGTSPSRIRGSAIVRTGHRVGGGRGSSASAEGAAGPAPFAAGAQLRGAALVRRARGSGALWRCGGRLLQGRAWWPPGVSVKPCARLSTAGVGSFGAADADSSRGSHCRGRAAGVQARAPGDVADPPRSEELGRDGGRLERGVKRRPPTAVEGCAARQVM